MSTENLPFTHTHPGLLPVLAELIKREPIFHTAEFGVSNDDFARMMAPDYWEVGASGRRYSRDGILSLLKDKPTAFASELGWMCNEHALRQLGPDTYLLTYVLWQGERRTRRATIWQRVGEHWQILYHQGTLATDSSRSS